MLESRQQVRLSNRHRFLFLFFCFCFCFYISYTIRICFLFKMERFRMNIATGCMEFLGMKHHVRVIGRAGMELPPNSYA